MELHYHITGICEATMSSCLFSIICSWFSKVLLFLLVTKIYSPNLNATWLIYVAPIKGQVIKIVWSTPLSISLSQTPERSIKTKAPMSDRYPMSDLPNSTQPYNYKVEFYHITQHYLETDPDPIAMVTRVELLIHKPCTQETPVT